MNEFEDFLICFWVVLLSSGIGYKLGEWIWRRFIKPCKHWPVVIHMNGSIECEICHRTLKKVNPKWR
jgi:hypothetical protein